MVEYTVPVLNTGFIVDIRHQPQRILEGTRFRKLDDLEQLISFLDMFTINNLINKRIIKNAQEYKSPFIIKENRPYYAGSDC